MEPFRTSLDGTLASPLQHTPGPWRVETLTQCCRVQVHVIGPHDTLVATATLKGPAGSRWLKPARYQTLANSHLIAAAPELYRLLQGLAQALEIGQSILPDSQTHRLIQNVLDRL
jgi:hypothetical protein